MEKSKVILFATGAVSIIIAAGIGLTAKGKFDAAGEAKSERDSNARALDRIYGGDVFPSEGNVAAMDDILGEFVRQRARFTNELVACNVDKSGPDEFSPSVFLSKLSEGVRSLRAAAPLVDGRRSVSDSFCFGFDAYFGNDETFPKKEEVPLMVQQLKIAAILAKELYAAQVSQLTRLEREAHDGATLAMKRDSSPRRSEPAYDGGRDGDGRPEQGRTLFTTQRTVLEFQAKQNALVDFLDRLNSLKRPFIIVSSISVKKIGEDVKKAPVFEKTGDDRPQQSARSARRTRRAGRRGEEPEEHAAQEQPAQAAPAPTEMPAELRIVSGPDVDPLLAVRLELDIFNFGEEDR